jgi:hypothetical protein
MISEHVPCQKLLFTSNLTLYVLLTHHQYAYLYLNLHGACNTGRNQISEKFFYWMPRGKVKPINVFNKTEHNEGQCLPDAGGSSNDFDDIPSQHTQLFETSLSKKVSFPRSSNCPAKAADCVNYAETKHCTSCMECYRQLQRDALLSVMNCCSKSDIIYFWLTASIAYNK